jgi:hypothetical protein
MDWDDPGWKEYGWWAAAVGFLLLALLLGGFFTWQLARQARFLVDGEQTVAVVASDVICTSRQDGTECRGEIRFRTASGEFVTADMAGLNESAQPGDAYLIRYLRSDATQVTTLQTRPLVVAVVFFAGAIVLWIILVVVGVRLLRTKLRTEDDEPRVP